MINVCYADVTPLQNDTLYQAAVDRLPTFRQKKAAALRTRNARNLSVGAFLVLQEALKMRGYDTQSLQFNVFKSGKPYIKNCELHFSLSHSGNIAMCAIGNNAVGVDVEEMSRFNPDVCKRFFKRNEYDAVFAQSGTHLQNDTFFRIWTIKESYVKMTGKGIGGFADFEIALKPQPHIKSDSVGCMLREFTLDGYKAALCSAEYDEVNFDRVNIIKPFVEMH